MIVFRVACRFILIAIIASVAACPLSANSGVVSCLERTKKPRRRERDGAGAECEVEIVDYFGTATNRAPVKLPSAPTIGA
jgi:hypothetical protein